MDFVAQAAERVLGIHPRALDILVPIAGALVPATLNVPLGARAIVAIFSPSGRSRYDAPNRFFAQVLEQAGLATLSLDPLETERSDEATKVVDWLSTESFTADLPIGLLAFTPELKLDVTGVAAWLVSPERTARAAELASELFVQRLLGSSR